MTNRELNAAIKKLGRTIANSNHDLDRQPEFKAEFLRLHRASSDFSGLNAKSILIMLSINSTWRFVALHQFGLAIDLKKII